jgi:hypothetical protein
MIMPMKKIRKMNTRIKNIGWVGFMGFDENLLIRLQQTD